MSEHFDIAGTKVTGSGHYIQEAGHHDVTILEAGARRSGKTREIFCLLRFRVDATDGTKTKVGGEYSQTFMIKASDDRGLMAKANFKAFVCCALGVAPGTDTDEDEAIRAWESMTKTRLGFNAICGALFPSEGSESTLVGVGMKLRTYETYTKKDKKLIYAPDWTPSLADA